MSYIKSLWLIENKMCVFFLFKEWEFKRKGSTTYSPDKNKMCSVLDLLVVVILTLQVIQNYKTTTISRSFHLCFKIIQIIGSTFKLRSSVMLGVFKIQDVFLGSWETARHGAPVWLHSLQCWIGFSCRLLVRWEAGKKHKKELMCSWKKDTRDSDILSGVSSAEEEVSISLLILDKGFYS